MPKVDKGRLDGVWGMTKRTATELYEWANKYEAQILNPKNTDDPKWLQRRADRLRNLAQLKEKSVEHKSQHSKQKTKARTTN